VPDYVPESDVTSIADLAKPSVAERMTKLIQGIGTGATITTVSQKAVGEYRLDALGYSLRPGTPAEWTGAYDAAVAERRWIVFPTWTPQYLNRGGTLRPLQDPPGVLGGINHASLVGPRDRLQAIPPATRAVLARMDLGLDGVTVMDWLVNVEKKTPREAARTWMKANESRVAGWLKACGGPVARCAVLTRIKSGVSLLPHPQFQWKEALPRLLVGFERLSHASSFRSTQEILDLPRHLGNNRAA
jgi:glycine betaine/proline transport system substrate-binding protein